MAVTREVGRTADGPQERTAGAVYGYGYGSGSGCGSGSGSGCGCRWDPAAAAGVAAIRRRRRGRAGSGQSKRGWAPVPKVMRVSVNASDAERRCRPERGQPFLRSDAPRNTHRARGPQAGEIEARLRRTYWLWSTATVVGLEAPPCETPGVLGSSPVQAGGDRAVSGRWSPASPRCPHGTDGPVAVVWRRDPAGRRSRHRRRTDVPSRSPGPATRRRARGWIATGGRTVCVLRGRGSSPRAAWDRGVCRRVPRPPARSPLVVPDAPRSTDRSASASASNSASDSASTSFSMRVERHPWVGTSQPGSPGPGPGRLDGNPSSKPASSGPIRSRGRSRPGRSCHSAGWTGAVRRAGRRGVRRCGSAPPGSPPPPAPARRTEDLPLGQVLEHRDVEGLLGDHSLEPGGLLVEDLEALRLVLGHRPVSTPSSGSRSGR